jgi:CheY-like chemotaxis protein
MKVLVIEDDPTDLKLMMAVLTMSGHVVCGITSAEEAAEAIAKERPDVILLDLKLPRMDGLALAHQLKGNALSSSIPITAITAYPDHYHRDDIVAAGCNACIAKPIDTRKLSMQLEQAAGGKIN